ncbi:MAG TPA: hypothetical protein VFL69_12665 [Marmoricola sp.]|nr:hypothetical protein [Marmoricola sp.]
MPTDEELTADELEQRQAVARPEEDDREEPEAPGEPPEEANEADFLEQHQAVPEESEEEERA